MKHILARYSRIELRGLHRLILPILVVVASMGCAALEGVNVGANIPIGGVVNVGASKTIGEQQAPAPRPASPRPEADESTEEED